MDGLGTDYSYGSASHQEPLPAADTKSRRHHADCGVPVGTGCTCVTAPGKCQVSQRAFQALPCR